MPTHKLSRSLHRGIREGSRGQSQGTSQGTLPHSPTQCHNRTSLIQNSSILYIRRLTVIPGLSRNPCSSTYMTLHKTGAWGNTNYCIYGTTCYKHHQHYSSSFQPSSLPHCSLITTPCFHFPIATAYAGGHKLFSSW